MRNKIKLLFTTVVFICLLQPLIAQEYFFVDNSVDSTSNDFYEYTRHFSVLYQLNWPDNKVGIALVLHNREQRLSYFFECKTNIQDTYITSGEDIDGNTVQKRVAYRTIILGAGLGIPILKNYLIYGSVGVRNVNTLRDTNPDRGYYFYYNNFTDIHVAGGVLYVADSKLTLLVGADFITKTLNLGIGYSL